MPESARRRFCESIAEQTDALLVTDDIAASHIHGAPLVGLDGWADGRLSGLDGSEASLNDFLLIEAVGLAELRGK